MRLKAEKAPAKSAPPAQTQKASATPEPVGKSVDTLSADALVAYGKEIYTAKGGNSCNDCHGMAGHNGRLTQAADLRKPTTWKAYKTTGGDEEKLKSAITELIRYGAGPWNAKHAEPAYDVTMLGVAQGPSKSQLRKVRKSLKKKHGIVLSKEDSLDFGARATYAYITTLWEEKLGGPPAAPAASPTATKEATPKE